jgi:hypothetical protein
LPEDNTGDDNNDNAVKKPETTNSKSVNQELKKSLQSKANILVSEVETKLKLGKIKLKREKCDEENAFYDSQTKDITVCDEMITQLYNYAQKESTDPKIQEEITANSLFFILFHELGHGYIDMYQLPITGKEEDVADQIATYLIL